MKYRINPEEIEIEEGALITAGSLFEKILIPVAPKEFPQYGDKYFYISSGGKVKNGGAYTIGSEGHDFRKKHGNMFRTQAEAVAMLKAL